MQSSTCFVLSLGWRRFWRVSIGCGDRVYRNSRREWIGGDRYGDGSDRSIFPIAASIRYLNLKE